MTVYLKDEILLLKINDPASKCVNLTLILFFNEHKQKHFLSIKKTKYKKIKNALVKYFTCLNS